MDFPLYFYNVIQPGEAIINYQKTFIDITKQKKNNLILGIVLFSETPYIFKLMKVFQLLDFLSIFMKLVYVVNIKKMHVYEYK